MKRGIIFATAVLGMSFALPAGGTYKTGENRAAPANREVIQFQRTIDSTAIQDFSKPRGFWKKLVTWIAGPAEIETLGRPYALTEDNLGRLLVADPERRVVHILDFERRRYTALTGSKKEKLLSPVGVAVDGRNNIYVSDSARGRIYIFDKKGKFRRTLSSNREGGRFLRPTGIALDAKRNLLYVTDTLRHQVLVLTTEGKLIRAIGRRGQGPAEFNFPTAVAIGQDGLYVLDAMNFRVQILTSEGEFVRQLGQQGNQTGTLFRPKGIALDSQGNLYVVDALFESVQVFDSQGQLLTYFGSGGVGEGKFSLPSGIYIAPRDQIFVADSLNRRVQVFRLKRKEP
jgi:DNA-binding beta-propeller fold protein YncE